MRFQQAKQIESNAPTSDVLDVIERQFSSLSDHHYRSGASVHVKQIGSGLATSLRTDLTVVTVKPSQAGVDIRSVTDFSPSVLFWIAFCVGFLLYGIGALIPLAVYSSQKKVVKEAILFALDGVESELTSQPDVVPAGRESLVDELLKLSILRDEGILTQSEFDSQKRRLLS